MKLLSETAEQFIYSLQYVEKTRDVESLVQLFADDAELTSPTATHPCKGKEGVRAFWRKHLANFRRVRSEITDVIEADPAAIELMTQTRSIVLEWSADAILPTGKPLTYVGVSVLEVAKGKIQRFRTYYDSLPLSMHMRRDDMYRQAG